MQYLCGFFSGYVSYILYIHSTCTVLTVVTNYLTVYKTYTQTGVYMSLPSGMLNTPFLNLIIINHCVWIYGNSNWPLLSLAINFITTSMVRKCQFSSTLPDISSFSNIFKDAIRISAEYRYWIWQKTLFFNNRIVWPKYCMQHILLKINNV